MKSIRIQPARFLSVLALSIAISCPALAHRFHVSLSEIEFDPETGRLEVALQVHPEHLEVALAKENGRGRVRLDSTGNVDRLIVRYLSTHFVLTDSHGERRRLRWVGKEVEVQSAWLYFEFTLPCGPAGARLENRVLVEPGNKQVNTVNLRIGKARSSQTFTEKEPRALLKMPAEIDRTALVSRAADATEDRAGKTDAEAAETSVRFVKQQLTETFYGEGAHVGDLDRDGDIDVFSGPYWYEGPKFTERHEIYPPVAFDPQSYSRNFLTFAGDFNGDGWTDVFHVGFPGAESPWFENPAGKPGHWKRHIAVRVTDNESPVLLDLTGDGQSELVFHTGGHFGYASYDIDKPDAEWAFHPISEKIAGGRFQHGLGVGDVNGDGRLDVLHKDGWLEQPASLDGDPLWTLHKFDFASARGGAQMYTRDFDRDGDNDVLTTINAHGYGLAWYEQVRGEDGGIDFRRHTIVGAKPEDNAWGVCFTQMHAISMADIDGDGQEDIVTGKRFWAHNGHDPEGNRPAVLYWFRHLVGEDGKVQFVPHLIDDNSGIGTQVLATRVSADERPDIVVGNKKGTFVFTQVAE